MCLVDLGGVGEHGARLVGGCCTGIKIIVSILFRAAQSPLTQSGMKILR